ncbi:MAG: hypothetical protein KIT10_14515 [Flavobacteriales bacterium]|nr:hypothetical protein [Flavobacteriales bacterium]
MARNNDLIARRNAQIRKDYEKLRSAKQGRKPKFTAEYVISLLSERYYLSERRIEDLVWTKG